jgi:hypothetical protein
MHKNAMKCNETLSKWCKSKHGASKIIDTVETYQRLGEAHNRYSQKNEKLRLSSIIDNLEALAKVRPLLPHEIELKSQLNVEIARLLREEEIKWYQRSKSQLILEGDANTRYFHSVANGRQRKKLIHSLVQDEGIIEGHENLKSFITNYYKCLFGSLEDGNFSMDETRIDDIPEGFRSIVNQRFSYGCEQESQDLI